MLGAQVLGVIVGNTLGNDNCDELQDDADINTCKWFKMSKNHPLKANAETFDYLKVRLNNFVYFKRTFKLI